MSPPPVVVVVLNWNGREDTLACLRSLARCDYPNLQTLVVDNGSTDGSEPAVRAAFPELPLLQTGANLGFAGGNNAGIAWALERGAEWVLLLNNDTEVEPELVSAMMSRAQGDERIGIVGAAIAYAREPQRLWAYGGGRFNVATGRVRHVQFPVPDAELLTKDTIHFYVTGCAMLLRAALLRRVGVLDTSYFHFCEDADLCLRAEAAGYRCAVAPDARLRHKVSATTRVSSPLFLYYNLRSRLRLVTRFGPQGAPSPWALAVLWMRLWRPALQSGMGWQGWRALRRARRDFQHGVQGPAPVDLASRGARAAKAGDRRVALLLLLVGSPLALLGVSLAPPALRAQPADSRGNDDLGAHLRALTGDASAGTAPLEQLLWEMAQDPAREAAVLARANASHRALTDTLLATLRWTEPRARLALPGLYVVRDEGPPPGQRPPSWADVRRAGLALLRAVALDETEPAAAAFARTLDPRTPGERTTPSQVGGQVERWEGWWSEHGLNARYYLDPARIPDVGAWLQALRAESPREAAPGSPTPLLALLEPLAQDALRRNALLARLTPATDAPLVSEAMAILPMVQDDFKAAGLPPARWDPQLGRRVGHHPDELRRVALAVLEKTSDHLASGTTDDEVLVDQLRWWLRGRFQARFYRDPRAAPSLQPLLAGLERPEAQGGRPLHRFLHDAYVAAGYRDLLLDRWAQTRGPGCVAELMEWLRKDRAAASAAGFDFAWRRLPVRPAPGDRGELVAIPWDEVQALTRGMLHLGTGEPRDVPAAEATTLAASDDFWLRWWESHREEARWYREGAAPRSPPRFAPQRERAR